MPFVVATNEHVQGAPLKWTFAGNHKETNNQTHDEILEVKSHEQDVPPHSEESVAAVFLLVAGIQTGHKTWARLLASPVALSFRAGG